MKYVSKKVYGTKEDAKNLVEYKKGIALDERKHLQDIIHHIELERNKRVKFSLAAAAAYSAAFFSGAFNVACSIYLLGAIVLFGMFYYFDMLYRVGFYRAKKRVADLEKILRENITHYKGPETEDFLSRRIEWGELVKYGLKDRHVFAHYCLALAIIIFSVIAKDSNQNIIKAITS